MMTTACVLYYLYTYNKTTKTFLDTNNIYCDSWDDTYVISLLTYTWR